MKIFSKLFILLFMMIMSFNACKNSKQPVVVAKDDFNYFVEQFDDIRVLKYKLPGFEALSLQQKEYIYYLSQAALAGQRYILGSELQI